jgi:GTPase SAR1 family protein
MLVFSLDSKESLEKLLAMKERTRSLLEGKVVPVMLVGNKSDLPTREVSAEQGEWLAKTFGASYIEVSCKEATKVGEAFAEMVRAIRRV